MIRISKDHSQDMTLFTVTGETTVEEIIDAVTSFYSSEPTRLLLLNFLEAKGSSFTPDDIDKIISIVSRYAYKRKGGKTALVAASDHVYGMSRMFKAKSEVKKIQLEVHVTRTMEEALHWLDVTL